MSKRLPRRRSAVASVSAVIDFGPMSAATPEDLAALGHDHGDPPTRVRRAYRDQLPSERFTVNHLRHQTSIGEF